MYREGDAYYEKPAGKRCAIRDAASLLVVTWFYMACFSYTWRLGNIEIVIFKAIVMVKLTLNTTGVYVNYYNRRYQTTCMVLFNAT